MESHIATFRGQVGVRSVCRYGRMCKVDAQQVYGKCETTSTKPLTLQIVVAYKQMNIRTTTRYCRAVFALIHCVSELSNLFKRLRSSNML